MYSISVVATTLNSGNLNSHFILGNSPFITCHRIRDFDLWPQTVSQSCASSVIKKTLSIDILSIFPVSLSFWSDLLQAYAFDSDIQFCYICCLGIPCLFNWICEGRKKLNNHCQLLVNYLIYKYVLLSRSASVSEDNIHSCIIASRISKISLFSESHENCFSNI